VRQGGIALPALPGKQRVLLAALLLRANCPVSLDELTDVLWGHEPPASARGTLRNYVKELRKRLDAGPGSRLVTVPAGYQLHLTPGELDLGTFEKLQASATAAANAGDWQQASVTLREALSLWRGDPLADVPSERLALREAPRLAELRLQAVEARIEADLHQGGHTGVIAELRQLAALHPFRERLHGQLMLALYRDGQQAEALASYQRVRAALLDELGVEPGEALRLLQQQIISADPALASPAAARAGAAVSGAAVSGAAVSGAAVSGAAVPAAAVPGAAAVPHQLPAAVRHFTGRAAELAALTGMLRDAGGTGRTAVISAVAGTAGVGKTAAAVHWAHQVADWFPDGQLYVDLRGYAPGEPMPAAEALARFLRALRKPGQDIPAEAEERAAEYRSLLSGRRVLIMLDNARSAEQVRPLLPGTPACAVLVTSRDALTGLVARDGAQRLELDVLPLAEAASLLQALIGGRASADRPATTALAGLCGCLPLALRVAAELVAAHPAAPLAGLVAELAGQRSRLDLLDAGGDPRTAVRAVFSWSYQHLDPAAARAFRLLGLHPGGDFEPYSVAALAGLTLAEATRLLADLARASLLQRAGAGRYGVHDLLKAYAAELTASQDGEADAAVAVTRLLDYYLHTSHNAAMLLNPSRDPLSITPPQPAMATPPLQNRDGALDWFEAEHGVLLRAVSEAAARGLGAQSWQLAVMLASFLCLRGYQPECIEAMRTALGAAEASGEVAGQAHLLQELGGALLLLGRDQDATVELRRALRLSGELGDRSGQAWAHHYLCVVYERDEQYAQALRHALRALRLFRAVKHLSSQARALNNVGWYRAHLGYYRQALTSCQRAIDLHRQVADRRGEAAAWDSLGFAHHHLGDGGQAVACYQRAVDSYREVGDRHQTAAALTHLGDVHHAAGDPRAAGEAWDRARQIFEDLGDPGADTVRAKVRALAGSGQSRP
jgi:DNA-binding SARP family transcriptional activator/Tfp pilus assembly protein PilF